QGLRTVRIQHNSENLSAKGAYILKEAESDHKVTLYASGSEVEIILDAAEILENDKIGARVVSVPSMEHFYKQDVNYQKDILKGDIRIACEAALKQGWEGFISDSDAFVGMEGFGASAPYKDLYKAFGITAEKIVGKVKSRL
ncbi:MAG: transketolase C-terminal domain-containing protein, partial [Pseudomonadota bacterium]